MSKEDLRVKQIYTGSPSVSLRCFVESGELERCLRYFDLKKFIVDACSLLADCFKH